MSDLQRDNTFFRVSYQGGMNYDEPFYMETIEEQIRMYNEDGDYTFYFVGSYLD